mgnify:CR=1 FL=1
MFRPLDIPIYDTNWPIENGQVKGLSDIRVIIHTRSNSSAFPIPCEVVVTNVTSTSIRLALANRTNLSVYNGTAMIINGFTAENTGLLVRRTNDIMTVDVTLNATPLSYVGTLPLRIAPCCVMWLPPFVDSFDMSKLPTPGTGWSRTINTNSHVITYTADAHIDNGTPTDGRLRMINGVSQPNITIQADGEGTVVSNPSDASITITAGER